MPRKIKRKDREKFLEVLAEESGMAVDSWAVQHFGKLMMRHAATYGRLYDAGEPYEKRASSEKHLMGCAKKLGVDVVILVSRQSKPRALTVILNTPKTSKGGKLGWGVPTS